MSSRAINPGSRPYEPDEADQEDDGWSEGLDDDSNDERKPKRAKTGSISASSRPMSVSCELCKQRKVKCDRGQPQCGWCVRNGQVCQYKERKKPGLRAGYGRELESRLDRLEGVLQTQQTLLQQLATYLPSAAGIAGSNRVTTNSIPDLSSPVSHHSVSQVARGEQAPMYMHASTPVNLSTDAAVSRSDEARLSVAGEPGHSTRGDYFPRDMRQHQSTTSPMTTYPQAGATSSRSDEAHLNVPGELGQSTGGEYSGIAPTGVSQDHDFPPYDLLYALTDLFFKHINTWCPILHRRSTLDALFGATALDEADRILLHAIVATTLRFSADPRLTDAARDHYHAASKQKVLLYGLENSSVKALQALVILALDTVGSSNGPPGWNLLALITRSVVQLGLAVETTSSSVAPLYPSIYTLRAMVLPEPKSFIEDESRRRLFWMVYLLDRYATIATAFEFALDEKEIDRKLPCRDDLFSRNLHVDTRFFRSGGPAASTTDYGNTDRPENLGSFSYYVEIVGILSQVHQFLKRPVDIGTLADVEQWQREYRQLDARLNDWKFGLPNEQGNTSRLFASNGGNKTVNCIWIMLHVTYHTTVIRLHSSAAYPTTRSSIFTPSYAASQRCLSAVGDISALASYVRSNALLPKLGPHFAFSCWVAARLLLVHGSTIDHVVDASAVGGLIETLREMGGYWGVAARYATLLQRVMDEYADASARRARGEVRAVENDDSGDSSTAVAADQPGSVRILADMRRTAFDLDFLISRQPRLAPGGRDNGSIPASAPVQAGNGPTTGIAQEGTGHLGPSGTRSTALPTPTSRTPNPAELEYLDVFDFFNMPRLPFPTGPAVSGGGYMGSGEELNEQVNQDDVASQQPPQDRMVGFGQQVNPAGMVGGVNNEFNITNFMYDVNADWLGDMGK